MLTNIEPSPEERTLQFLKFKKAISEKMERLSGELQCNLGVNLDEVTGRDLCSIEAMYLLIEHLTDMTFLEGSFRPHNTLPM